MKINFLALLICTLLACNNQKAVVENESIKPAGKMSRANWLIGTWSNTSKDRHDYEVWKKYNDSTYLGRSYSIQKGDTVSSESIRLEEQGEEIHYIPTVQGQNNDLPVTFKLISLDSKELIFENQSHDFPQRISYRQVSPDSLVAEISGLVKGEYQAMQFPMRRAE
jgi:hypothetical protein